MFHSLQPFIDHLFLGGTRAFRCKSSLHFVTLRAFRFPDVYSRDCRNTMYQKNVRPMKHVYSLSLVIFMILTIISCSNKNDFEGDSVSNYPDMAMLLKNNLEPYQQSPYTFMLSTRVNGKKDSSILKAEQVDWKAITEPFLKANLYQKELDGHYKIDIMTDTIYGKSTMLLTSLDPKAITSRLSINARLEDNKILSIYAETRDAGVLNTTEHKLLYVNGKSIQDIETIKHPFSDAKVTIRTLTFLN